MLYITCDLLHEDIPLCGTVTSSFQPFEDNIIWNQWLYTPIKYKDLPLSTYLLIKVWDTAGPGKRMIIGQASIPLYSKSTRRVKEGMYKINLVNPHKSSTSVSNFTSSSVEELARLEKVCNEGLDGNGSNREGNLMVCIIFS